MHTLHNITSCDSKGGTISHQIFTITPLGEDFKLSKNEYLGHSTSYPSPQVILNIKKFKETQYRYIKGIQNLTI